MFLCLSVSHSVHRGVAYTPQADPLGRHPPQTDTPPWSDTAWADTPRQMPPMMATEASSTHPTGKHSCL